MAVYVDAAIWHFAGRRWCHLMADDEAELHRFARRLGLHRQSYQGPPKTSRHIMTSPASSATAPCGWAPSNAAVPRSWRFSGGCVCRGAWRAAKQGRRRFSHLPRPAPERDEARMHLRQEPCLHSPAARSICAAIPHTGLRLLSGRNPEATTGGARNSVPDAVVRGG
jgi:hypothetical protein